jgi:reductive dehalogenase
MKKPGRLSTGARAEHSRRSFLRACGGVPLAFAAGAGRAETKGLAEIPLKEIPNPTISTRKLSQSAEEIYECKGTLERFSGANMAFKKMPEELGVAFSRAFKENVATNIADGRIGHGVGVDSPAEARAHMALDVAADTWNKIIGPYGENRDNEGFRSWVPLKVPEAMYSCPDPDPDPADLAHKMKMIATYVGADRVGITHLNRKWVYSEKCLNSDSPEPPITKKIVFRDVEQPAETESELVIPESVTNAIVFVTVQPRMSTEIGPATFQTMASTSAGYSWSGLTAVALAEAVRFMGYVAIPCMNETAMSVPLAIDAGLGQLGRLGYLITPWFGPHVRIAKVLTNMPLAHDSPIDFGVTDYCMECGVCAMECPSGAISPDVERSFTPLKAAGPCGSPGSLKWYINGKRCLKWWVESGATCSRCTSVCPYTNLTLGSYLGEDPSPESFWDAEFGQYGHREIIY